MLCLSIPVGGGTRTPWASGGRSTPGPRLGVSTSEGAGGGRLQEV